MGIAVNIDDHCAKMAGMRSDIAKEKGTLVLLVRLKEMYPSRCFQLGSSGRQFLVPSMMRLEAMVYQRSGTSLMPHGTIINR